MQHINHNQREGENLTEIGSTPAKGMVRVGFTDEAKFGF